ncbi:MAG: nicotinate-nicotinamide nucleotide adenylyltransferase [Vibrio sp.]
MNIAIFGSAFNPPSLGHKSVIERLAHYDQILLVPSIAHAWGKEMIDFSTRCEMVEKFIEDLKENGVLKQVQLCKIEEELFSKTTKSKDENSSSITTFAVLSELQSLYPNSQLTFVLGPDNFLNFGKFYKADEITQRWSILACPESLPVRSTQIRQRLAESESLELLDLTTPSVETFIKKNKLYQ